MDECLRSFGEFMRIREEAAIAYVQGNPSALAHISTRIAPATFFGPRGDREQGVDKVNSIYKRDAAHFRSGETRLEILQLNAANGIAYWAGIQRATVKIVGKEGQVDFNLRVTELFRLEDGEWKLVHRHADQLKDEADQAASQ